MCNLLVPIRSAGASMMVCMGGEGGRGIGYTMLIACSKQQQLPEVLLCAG